MKLASASAGIRRRSSIPSSPQRTINLLGLGIVLSLLGDSTLYTVLPDPTLAGRVGLSLGWVGLLLGLNRVARLAFNSLAGLLYDRWSRRAILIGSLALGALCNVLYARASGPPLFVIGRVLWGAAWSGLWIGGNTAVLDLSSDLDRGRHSGRFQMWFFIGAATGALAGGSFTDLFGFRGGLWLSAAITAAAALMWLVWLPETRRAGPAASAQTAKTARSLRGLIVAEALPAAIPVFGARFVFAGVMASTTILWLEGFVGRELELGLLVVPLATLTGGFAAGRFLTSIVGAPLAGLLSDRLGRRWPVVTLSLLVGAAGVWMMGLPRPELALPGALIAAVTSGSVQALATAIVGDQIPEDRKSRAVGSIYTLGDLGSALGPPLALGLIPVLEIAGVYRLSAISLLLVGLFAAYEIGRERRRLGGE